MEAEMASVAAAAVGKSEGNPSALSTAMPFSLQPDKATSKCYHYSETKGTYAASVSCTRKPSLHKPHHSGILRQTDEKLSIATASSNC
jgi:hypothetical protein